MDGGCLENLAGSKNQGIFYVWLARKGSEAEDLAAYCVAGLGCQNCLGESVARGPALINNRGVSKGLKREIPPLGGGLTEGKGYDEARHHNDCVVNRKFCRLLKANPRGEKSSRTLVPLLQVEKKSASGRFH